MKEKVVLAIHGSHDASITLLDKTGKLRVIEVERIVKKRYAAFSSDYNDRSFGITDEDRMCVIEYINSLIDDDNPITHLIFSHLNADDLEMIHANVKLVKGGTVCSCFSSHHLTHAFGSHYQSNLDKTIILSIDGGGAEPEIASRQTQPDIVYTKVYLGDYDKISEQAFWNTDFGGAYSAIGWAISELSKREDDALSWAGKLMGLCGYGKVREEWKQPMLDYYQSITSDLSQRVDTGQPLKGLYKVLCSTGDITQSKDPLEDDHVRTFDANQLSGEVSYDLAATSQWAFEFLLFQWVQYWVDKYPERDLIMTGGCALNVLFNQKVAEYMHARGRKVYVPPNPNDCGCSLGMFFAAHKTQFTQTYTEHSSPTNETTTTFPTMLCDSQNVSYRGVTPVYDGVELLDKDRLETYVEERGARKIETSEIVDLLKDGKIIGLVYGDSEIGPRALGNRSIICDPSFKNMKDTLNAKVKFREWYRPFAPVCLLNDSHRYFHDVYESNYMSYAPVVRREFEENLAAITHVDKTSRLQTVCEETGHEVFRDILVEMKTRGEIPVILNTSFNIKGFPILTTIEDALHVLDNTELDYVIVEGYLFSNDKVS